MKCNTLELALKVSLEHVKYGRASHAEAWVAATLSPALPCGMEEPPIVSFGDGTCGVLVDDRGDPLDPDELRGYAATLLRLADDCEERNR